MNELIAGARPAFSSCLVCCGALQLARSARCAAGIGGLDDKPCQRSLLNRLKVNAILAIVIALCAMGTSAMATEEAKYTAL